MLIVILFVGFPCVATFKEYDYDGIGVDVDSDYVCEGAAPGSDLQAIDICLIQIDIATGRGTEKRCDSHCKDKQHFRSRRHWYYWDADWKWEGRTVTIALLVVRKDSKDAKGNIKYNRANENPVAFYSSAYEDCKFSKTGTGDDFSEMYKGNPFRPGNMTVKLTKGRKDVATLLKFVPNPDCYATDTWIANEGWYVLDKESNTWYPIYFDPVFSDQAFFF
ncbi:unnamed protein product [Cylicocyclus nassatus]|uniref:Uncharacterized protein n=1 Tax=Cylicocyclus nassatus TaxID=53992 RepID=A0AA36GWB2_CYLNA|nr:unnamed protein product [Cylicocyclus nassatus]